MAATIIPTLRYHDAPAAIEFLVEAFGFTVHARHQQGDVVEHAQLVLGDGMVMLGSTRREGDRAFDRLVTTVKESGSPTSTPYVIVHDVSAHAERARKAGAEIVIEPEGQDYGGSNYTARDPEGNLWSFGSYNPWDDPE